MAGVLSVTVRIDKASLDRYTTNPGGPVMGYLARLGQQVLNESQRRVNVDTGYLRSTGEVVVRPADAEVEVVYRARYARYVHNGNGRYPGNPYLTDALAAVLGR